MAIEAITIEVDADAARAYAGATSEEQQKIQLLLRLRLRDLTIASARPLREVMDEISTKAEARGLTPEILESLLHEQ